MKRITLFAGHYGSGKTNVALNYAQLLRKEGKEVTVADLDIVNPYFRTKDSAVELAAEGIQLVVSDYANSNVDFPALPKEIYALTAPSSLNPPPFVVMDIGGDDRGALALGRYVPDILAENDYEMVAVINAARPLTRTSEATVDVLREIEAACKLPFTGIVNNTNIGPQTTAADVLSSRPYAEAVAAQMGISVRFTCAAAPVAHALARQIPDLLPLDIQKLYYHLDT